MYLIISDIHGNDLALKAIFEHAKSLYTIEQVIFMGDMFTLGPNPEAVFQLMNEYPNKILLRGNHEEYLVDQVHLQTEGRIGHFPLHSELYRMVKASLQRTNDALGEMAINQFTSWLSDELVLMVNQQKHLFYHGTPDSIYRGVHPDDCHEYLQQIDHDVMWGGHIHLQYLKEHQQQIFVNPGGSGLPFDLNHDAPYAVIDQQGQVHLHRVPYDWQKIVSLMKKLENVDPFSVVLQEHIKQAKLVKYPFID